MALLRKKGADQPAIPLRAQHSVGRDPSSDIVLARPSISGRHATLSWTTSGWVLRDASTYGTLVNGAPVKGTARPLKKNDELTFVEADEVWTLVDDAPPGLLLVAAGAVLQVDPDRVLALPSTEDPQVTLFLGAGDWFVESSNGSRQRIADGAELDLAGTIYRASVPRVLLPTAEPENPASPFTLDAAELDIAVLRGEDEARVTIRSGAVEKAVGPSRPLYLLAYLAEQRAKSPDDDGWLPTDLVCRELNVERVVLNVEVHRIREAVKATGLVDGANVVERRPSQIRIGVPAARYRIARR
jgi:hypothetical protein